MKIALLLLAFVGLVLLLAFLDEALARYLARRDAEEIDGPPEPPPGSDEVARPGDRRHGRLDEPERRRRTMPNTLHEPDPPLSLAEVARLKAKAKKGKK